jgi:hypothetical protein
MFRTIGTIVFAVFQGFILTAAVDSQAEKLPDSGTYLYYIQGTYAGKSTFELTEDKDIYVFISTSDIEFGEYSHTFTARTEIEKETLKLRFFKYEGKRTKQTMSGTIWADGDSLSADNAIDGNHYSSGLKLTTPTYLFQDYFSEHQIIMLWAISRAKDPFMRFSILLPSDFMLMPSMATLDSEIELSTGSSAIVCKKYGVSIQNSGVYFLYLDPKQDLPVYMDFPATQAEGFLESAFGKNPPTKYTAPPPPVEQ